MALAEWTLMSNDIVKLPYDVIFITCRQMVHDLVVCQDILISIIIDTTSEFDIGRGILSVIQVFIDGFYDAELGCLTILLCDLNCPSNQLFWVYDGHSWLCLIVISSVIINV